MYAETMYGLFHWAQRQNHPMPRPRMPELQLKSTQKGCIHSHIGLETQSNWTYDDGRGACLQRFMRGAAMSAINTKQPNRTAKCETAHVPMRAWGLAHRGGESWPWWVGPGLGSAD